MGTVIPLQFLGVCDTELSQVSADEQLKSALANMDKCEGGYAVRHGGEPVSDFGFGKGKYERPTLNLLAAAYPMLFPYGEGGLELERKQAISFDEQV